MRKRAIALLTTMAVLSMLLPLFSGCAKENGGTTAYANGIYDEELSFGDWLHLVNEKFEFTNSSTATAFEGLSESDPYYQDVQIAAAMGVIPDGMQKLDLDQKLTRDLCAVTLAGAFYYTDDTNTYIADLTSSQYPDQVKTVVNQGIMGVDAEGKFYPDEIIKYVEASISLENAYNAWATYKFLDTQYQYELTDEVIDLAGISTIEEVSEDQFAVDENYVAQQEQLMEEQHFSYDAASGKISLDDVSAIGATEGSVITIPDPSSSTGATAVKVVHVIETEEGTYELETETADLEDIFEDLNYHETMAPDFNACNIYDANDNLINFGENGDGGILDLNHQTGVAAFELSPTSLLHQKSANSVPAGSDTGIQNLTFAESRTWTVKFKDGSDSYSIKVKMDSDSVKLSVETETSGDEIPFSKKGTYKDSSSIGTSMKVSNFNVNNAVEISRFCGVPSGIKYLRSSVSFDTDTSVTLKSKRTFERKLFKVAIPCSVPGITVNLTMKLKLTMSGELILSTSVDGWEFGMEYRDGELHGISHHGDPQTDLYIKAKLELTAPIELSLAIVSEKVAKAYVEGSFGVGLQAEDRINTIEYPGESPYDVECIDANLYLVLKVKAGVEVFEKWDLSKEWEFLNKDNCTLQKWHFEDFQLVNECSVDAAKRAQDEAAAAEHAEQSGVTVGDALELSVTSLELVVGEQGEIKLTQIPASCDIYKDLYVCITDPDVLSATNASPAQLAGSKAMVSFLKGMQFLVFSSGDPSLLNIKAEKAGSATVTYMTKDSKYKASCQVTVVDKDDERSQIDPVIGPGLMLTEGVVHVPVGGTAKLSVAKMPAGVTEADLVWENVNSTIATVDSSGTVTGVSYGVTTVVVHTKDNAYTFRCTVNVYEPSGVLSQEAVST